MAIVLESDNARVVIAEEFGGRIAELTVGGHELLVGKDENPLLWGCYPMVPWAGRLRHGRLAYAGTTHALPLTLPPHAIHGTTWNRAWQRVADNTLEISLREPWPFGGRAEHGYWLGDNALRLRLEVHSDDTEFPASLGWHPWFRRALDGGATATLDFAAGLLYERDQEDIPTGKLTVPGDGPWDDCFTSLVQPPRITWPGALDIFLESTVDHWMLYDMPAHAICIEPMSGPPDAPNLAPRIVSPGNPLCAEFTIRWQIQ